MLFLLVLLAVSHNLEEEGDRMLTVGERIIVSSELLGEDRTVSVSLPVGYDDSTEEYPLLIVLDCCSATAMAHAMSTMEILDGKSLAPQMIIAGVDTGNGTRDYFPKPLEGRPGSGEASLFLRFIEEELIPHMDGNYRTAHCRLLYGASNSGMFALFAMMERPDLFSGVIAASPSLGWFPDYFQARVDSFVPSNSTRLYFNWSDDDLESIVLSGTPQLAGALQDRFSGAGSCGYEVVQGGGHVPYVSLYNGLSFVFQSWSLPDTMLFTRGLSALTSHYQDLSDEYGFNVRVPSGKYMALGQNHFRAGRFQEAACVYEAYVSSWPDSPMAVFFLAECRRHLDDPRSAAELYERVLELNPSFALARERLSSLTEVE